MGWDGATGRMAPSALPQGVYAAGRVTGNARAVRLAAPGEGRPGLAAARGGPNRLPSFSRDGTQAASVAPPALGHRRFVCICEDITESDVAQAVDEGFDDVQTLKRYSTVTMGPCQGKMCHRALVESAARRTGRPTGEIGATTARPPVRPVPLGALAGPPHMPVKRTPLHREARGARRAHRRPGTVAQAPLVH